MWNEEKASHSDVLTQVGLHVSYTSTFGVQHWGTAIRKSAIKNSAIKNSAIQNSAIRNYAIKTLH